MDIAQILKTIRNELQITQEEFAHAVHVSFSTVNRWENRKTEPNRMAKVLILDFCEKSGVSNNVIEDLKKYK